MGFHLVVQLCFCVASIVVWHSFVAHTAFIVVIVGVAVHNGSTYTFRVFATRYADELVDKHPHILADWAVMYGVPGLKGWSGGAPRRERAKCSGSFRVWC